MTDKLRLHALLLDPNTPWQVHNCKISEQTVTQSGTLPLMYHYDTLASDVKADNPLSTDALKAFNQQMSVDEAANFLDIPIDLFAKPWFVKIVGTLVLFCEPLQLAIRLKFTNTAKPVDAIYCDDKVQALRIAMQDWHCFESVFVLNKSAHPVAVLALDGQAIGEITNQDADGYEHEHELEPEHEQANLQSYYELSPQANYQQLPPPYDVAILTLIDADTSSNNRIRALMNDAIAERLG